MALIDCPECNTEVSSAAPSCPRCGFPVAQEAKPDLSDFVGDEATHRAQVELDLASYAEPPKAQQPEKAKRATSTRKKILIGVATIAGLLYLVGKSGGGGGYTPSSNPHVQSQPQRSADKPTQQARAAEILREVKENEVAFERKWEGKRARITGRIEDIDADISGATLRLGKSWRAVVMVKDIPKMQVEHLTKGEVVTVVCDSLSEIGGYAVGSDCRRSDYR